jgi:hypothetical protein
MNFLGPLDNIYQWSWNLYRKRNLVLYSILQQNGTKEARSKTGLRGGGTTFCIKISTVGPNDIIFFPVKIELRPDLVVEISTGNTSEISTELRSKSAILGDFG